MAISSTTMPLDGRTRKTLSLPLTLSYDQKRDLQPLPPRLQCARRTARVKSQTRNNTQPIAATTEATGQAERPR